MSRVWRQLRIRTEEGGWLEFNLLGNLSHDHLPRCAALQPRPWWERTLAWAMRSVCLTVVCIVVLFWTRRPQCEPPSNLQPVLDLNKPPASDDLLSANEPPDKLMSEKDQSPVVDTSSFVSDTNCRKTDLLLEDIGELSPPVAISPVLVTSSRRAVHSLNLQSGEDLMMSTGSVRNNTLLSADELMQNEDVGSEVNADRSQADFMSAQATATRSPTSSSNGLSKKAKKKVGKKITISQVEPSSAPSTPVQQADEADFRHVSVPLPAEDGTFPLLPFGVMTEAEAKAKAAKRTKAMMREERKQSKKQREKERELAKKPQRLLSGAAAAATSPDALDELIRGAVERDTSVKSKRGRAVAVVKPEVSASVSQDGTDYKMADRGEAGTPGQGITIITSHPNEVVVDSILAAAAQRKEPGKGKCEQLNVSPGSSSSPKGSDRHTHHQITSEAASVRSCSSDAGNAPSVQLTATRPGRPSNLFTQPQPSNSLQSPPDLHKPSSPLELASLIVSSVGKPERPHCNALSTGSSSPCPLAEGADVYSTKMSKKKPRAPSDMFSSAVERKPTKAGRSSSEVSQRYLDDPTQQPID